MFRLGLSLFIALCFFASVSWGQSQDATYRTWTDSTGEYRIEASLVRVVGDTVVLKKQDGKITRVPIDRLSRDDQRIARAYLRPDSPQELGKGPAPRADIQISATISKEAPFGVIVIGDVETQNPIFVTLRIRGQAVIDAVKYGQFQFNSIKDDRGKTLKLLKPLEGNFNAKLDKEMVELDHFFLDRPDQLKLHLILQPPSKDAQNLTISGTFQLDVGHSITIDNVMSNLGKPLVAPGLDKIGKFSASLPRRGEADVAGALAIDFSGDRTRIDDVELLNGDGQKISTGGTGSGSRQTARYIRWTGEQLPKDTKLRIVLKGEPKRKVFQIELDDIQIGRKKQQRDGERHSSNITSGKSANKPQSLNAKTSSGTGKAPVQAPRQTGIGFFQASSQGDLQTVRTLLGQYPSLLKRKDPRWQGTALTKACWAGQLNIVEFLVKEGADMNTKTVDGFTPLHQAARRGHIDIVRFLLRNGADANAKDKSGGSPADWAEKDGQPKIAEEIKRFKQ